MAVSTATQAPSIVYQAYGQTNEKTSKLLSELNQAIAKGSLEAYLKTVNPDQLMLDLSYDWKNAPYLAILSVCDATVARTMLAGLATSSNLCDYISARRATCALEVFNSPERLPVFIEALRLGREKQCNSIPVTDLILRNNNHEAGNPFRDKLPKNVAEALEIENRRTLQEAASVKDYMTLLAIAQGKTLKKMAMASTDMKV